MLKAIEARSVNDMAKRALQTSSQVFRYAIAHGKATRNPATDIKPSDVLASRQKQNLARIDGKELPGLLRHIDAYKGAATTRLAMKLMAIAITFVRTTELIGARWDELGIGNSNGTCFRAHWDGFAGSGVVHGGVLSWSSARRASAGSPPGLKLAESQVRLRKLQLCLRLYPRCSQPL